MGTQLYYNMADLRVRNAGSLAAYVVITINGITGDAELLDVIEFQTHLSDLQAANEQALIRAGMDDVLDGKASLAPMIGTPNGTVLWDSSLMPAGEVAPNNQLTDSTATLTFSGHMLASAGNEYQNKTIEGISISVVATQCVWEEDSFNRYYDQNAVLPVVVTNADDLKAALQKGAYVILGDDITLTKGIAPADGAVIDFNGHYITDSSAGGRTIGVQNGVTVTVKGEGGIKIDPTVASQYAMPFYVSKATLIVDGGTYEMGPNTPANYGILGQNNSKVIINGGTFTTTDDYPLFYMLYTSELEINGGHFESIGAANPDLLDLEYNKTRISTITIKGGTFVNYNPLLDDEGAKLEEDTNGLNEARVVVADGYKVVSETKANGDVWYTVVPV